MLTQEHKQKKLEFSQQYFCLFEKESNDFLKKVITCDKTWVGHLSRVQKQYFEWKHSDSPVKKKFKSKRSTDKVTLTLLCVRNVQRPITISSLEKGSTC